MNNNYNFSNHKVSINPKYLQIHIHNKSLKNKNYNKIKINLNFKNFYHKIMDFNLKITTMPKVNK